MFLSWLEENSSVSGSTIALYDSIVKRFMSEYSEITIENANKFITKNFRQRRNYCYKYALRYLFKMENMEEEFKNNVVRVVKKKDKKRIAIYLPRDQLLRVIHAIDEDMFHTIAFIQMYTGCRSYEVLRLRWKHIRPDKAIHVMQTKTRNLKVVRVPEWLLESVLKLKPDNAKESEFIFWNGKIKELSLYKRYINKLQKASESVIGKKMGTHDFRFSFSRAAYEFYKGDLLKVKAAMGHSNVEQTEKYIGELAIDKKKLAEGIYEDADQNP